MAKDIFDSKKWFNSMDSVTEIRTVNEAVNPDVHRSVNGFIKKMANKYNYPLQSAVNAIMSVLRSQKYKVESVNEVRYNVSGLNDIKDAYYTISDEIQDMHTNIKNVSGTTEGKDWAEDKSIDMAKEAKLFNQIEKLFNQSKFGKVL